MAGFRFSVFDPALILLQICALQCLFYTVLAALLSATAHYLDVHVELRLVLSTEVFFSPRTCVFSPPKADSLVG